MTLPALATLSPQISRDIREHVGDADAYGTIAGASWRHCLDRRSQSSCTSQPEQAISPLALLPLVVRHAIMLSCHSGHCGVISFDAQL